MASALIQNSPAACFNKEGWRKKLYLDYEKMSEYSEGVLCWPDVSAELLLHTWLLLIFEQARSRVRMSLCGESSASLTS